MRDSLPTLLPHRALGSVLPAFRFHDCFFWQIDTVQEKSNE
jgi:hypothetical protein